jgi:hypothetical protein
MEDVELSVPQTPVALAPGSETQVSVEVSNRSGAALSLRLSVAPTRAGAWAHPVPASMELAAGDRAAFQVVFRTPDSAVPNANLLPFTVRADDLRSGTALGRATGLLTVKAPDRLDAVLTPMTNRGRTLTLNLGVRNRTAAPLSVAVKPKLDPPGRRLEVEPAVMEVPASGTASAQIRAKVRGHLVGATAPYALTVDCRDAAAGDDALPLATVENVGKAKPRVGRRTATILVAVLLVLGTAGGVVVGRFTDLPWRKPKLPVSTVEVRKPYALVDVFPRREGPQGKAAAEAARDRLTAAGMPVRLVDSTQSDQVADGEDGFYVLLKDGFDSYAQAKAFCDQFRSIAPNCQVVA